MIQLGMWIHPWGRCGAVWFHNGERTYFFTNNYGIVSEVSAKEAEGVAMSDEEWWEHYALGTECAR